MFAGAAEIAIGHRGAVLRILHRFAHQAIGARAARFQTGHCVLRQTEHVPPVLGKLSDAGSIELRVDCSAVIGGELNASPRSP